MFRIGDLHQGTKLLPAPTEEKNVFIISPENVCAGEAVHSLSDVI